MKYIKFEINKFKGINSLILDLDLKPNSKIFTLVGLNESGKTTILEAVNSFARSIPHSQRHTLIPKSDAADFTGHASIKATLQLDDDDKKKIGSSLRAKGINFKDIVIPDTIVIERKYAFKSAIPDEPNTGRYYNLVGQIQIQKSLNGPFTKLKSDQNQVIINFIDTKLLPDIIYHPDFLSKFPEKIYLEPKTDNQAEEQYAGIIEDVLASMGKNFTVKDHILPRINKADPANRQALEKILSLISGKITRVVFGAWGKFSNVDKKEISVSHGVDEEGRIYLELKIKEGVDTFHIAERSLGFRWFFSFLLFTEFRKNRTTSTGDILFLLDEPASNLHSTAQKKLLSTFTEITKKSYLVYATHSEHLINPEWLSGAYIVRNKALDYTNDSDFDFDAAQTDVEAVPYKRFVLENPGQTAYFQPILDVLEYQPGLLEMVPRLFVTEGKNDFYAFKYIAELYFKGQYDDFKFYPGLGANKLHTVISLYLGWCRGFVVVLDADKGGKSAKKLYIKDYGKLLEDKIFEYSDVLPTLDGYALEDMFTDSEKLEIVNAFDASATKYDKSKFNTGLQLLYVQKTKINLSSTTLDKFKAILEFAKVKLAN